MSRGYLKNFPNYEQMIRSGMKAEGVEDQFDSVFSRKNSKIFSAAARLVRFYASEVKKLRDCYDNSGPHKVSFKDLFEGQPLTILGSTSETFKVFPNIIVGDVDPDQMQDCCWAMSWQVLDETFERQHKEDNKEEYKRPLSWFENLENDLKDQHKAKGWSTLRRAITRLKRSDEIAITKVLTHAATAKMKANEIQNMASAIIEARKPMEIKEVKTLEDTVEMYATGPSSCMSWNSVDEDIRGWAFLPNKLKMHPTAFFHYHPHIQGVYAMAKGSVIARTFLYAVETKKGDVWHYGRIYAINEKIKQIFISTLAEKYGAKDVGGAGTFNRACEFQIPGVQYKPKFKDAYICPIPYFDNMYASYTVSFDNETSAFIIRTGVPTDGTAGSGGYLLSTSLTRVKCNGCSRTRRPNEMIQANDAANYFCGDICMTNCGYARASRSDGIPVVVPIAETVQDCISKARYTNEATLKTLGGLPYMDKISLEGPDEVPEAEDELTANGAVVKINNNLYRVGSVININILERVYNKNPRDISIKRARLVYDNKFGAYYDILYPEVQNVIPMKIQKVRTVVYDPDELFVKEAA